MSPMNPVDRLIDNGSANLELELQRNKPMHPFYDPEGQLAAYERFAELLDRERREGSLFGPLLAALLAMVVTPTAFWVIAVLIELGMDL